MFNNRVDILQTACKLLVLPLMLGVIAADTSIAFASHPKTYTWEETITLSDVYGVIEVTQVRRQTTAARHNPEAVETTIGFRWKYLLVDCSSSALMLAKECVLCYVEGDLDIDVAPGRYFAFLRSGNSGRYDIATPLSARTALVPLDIDGMNLPWRGRGHVGQGRKLEDEVNALVRHWRTTPQVNQRLTACDLRLDPLGERSNPHIA